MSKNLFHLFLLVSAVSMNSCTHSGKINLSFTNPAETERTGEVITLGNSQLTALIGEFPENNLPLFISGNDTLTAQFVDLNDDNVPEEILIEIDLGPKEIKTVKVVFLPSSQYPEFPRKTNIRFARKSDVGTEIMKDERMQTFLNTETAAVYQMEGPAWENDKVGFRNYFDFRNGMDIFGKTSPEMVLDGVGLGDNYHELADWGMDVLKVGNSLGAGSFGVEMNNNLYRIGDNGISTFERIFEGPLRSEYRFVFPEWVMDSLKNHITHYITITAGQYAYKSTVFTTGLPGDAHIISGIVNMLSDSLYTVEAGDYVCLYTHDIQTENKVYLAMALMTPASIYAGSGEAENSGSGIIETYYAKMKPMENNQVTCFFYALWENSDSRFADPVFVKEYLVNEGVKLSNPIKVSRIK